jgi:putative NADH-flavin reductase
MSIEPSSRPASDLPLAILGATGFVGRHLVEQALQRGHTLRILVRSATSLDNLGPRVEILQGDYFDPRAVRRTLEGCGAVLSTIGPPSGRRHGLAAEDYGKAMQALVGAMQDAGIRRFVYLAGAGTSYPGEKIVFRRAWVRMAIRLVAPLVIPAKERELAVLMNSDLDWTCIRPPMIREVRQGKLHADEHRAQGYRVDVDQLVGFMLDQIQDSTWIRKNPFVGTRS